MWPDIPYEAISFAFCLFIVAPMAVFITIKDNAPSALGGFSVVVVTQSVFYWHLPARMFEVPTGWLVIASFIALAAVVFCFVGGFVFTHNSKRRSLPWNIAAFALAYLLKGALLIAWGFPPWLWAVLLGVALLAATLYFVLRHHRKKVEEYEAAAAADDDEDET